MSNFKKRNNIKQYRVTGEAGSAPIEDLPKYREELQSLISQYSLEDGPDSHLPDNHFPDN